MENKTSIAVILKNAAAFFKSRFGVIFRIAAMTLFPFYALFFLFAQSAAAVRGEAVLAVPLMTGGILFTVVSLYFTAAVMLLAYVHKTAEPYPGFKSFLKTLLVRCPGLFGTVIVGGFLIALCYALLILPGVFVMILWAFLFQAAVIRRKIAFEALDYSKSLVKGRWWKTFGYYLALMACSAVIFVFAGMVTSFIGGLFQGSAGTSSGGVQSVFWLIRAALQVFMDFAAAFGAAVMAYFFFQWEETSALPMKAEG